MKKDTSIDIDRTNTSPIAIQEKHEDYPPEDHNNIVYAIFLLFGIGILLPWNSVLTAMPFFNSSVNTFYNPHNFF